MFVSGVATTSPSIDKQAARFAGISVPTGARWITAAYEIEYRFCGGVTESTAGQRLVQTRRKANTNDYV